MVGWFQSCRPLQPLARGTALWAYIPEAKDPAQSSVAQHGGGHWSRFCWSSLQTLRGLPSLQQWRHENCRVSGLPWWSRVKTWPSTAEGTVLIDGWKTKIHMLCSAAKKKELWDLVLQQPQFSSVQFSHSVVSDSLRPHESQHARLPCPSPSPGICSNSCPLIWWCHPTISSSVVPFLLSISKCYLTWFWAF